MAVLDHEAQMENTVEDRVDSILTKKSGGIAIALNPVEAGFERPLVVAMQRRPGIQTVFSDIGVEIVDIRRADVAVIGDAGGANGLNDQAVHAVGGRGAFTDCKARDLVVESPVGVDQINDLIEPGASGALGGHRMSPCRKKPGSGQRPARYPFRRIVRKV